MKIRRIVQKDHTGCGIACVAMLSGTTYLQAKKLATELGVVPDEIEERQCRLFDQVHPDYGAGVRQARATIKDRNPSISAPTDALLADASS